MGSSTSPAYNILLLQLLRVRYFPTKYPSINFSPKEGKMGYKKTDRDMTFVGVVFKKLHGT